MSSILFLEINSLQIGLLVLVPFVQLPVPLVVGGLGGVPPIGRGNAQAQIHQGGLAQVPAALVPPEDQGFRSRGIRRLCPRKAGGRFQVWRGARIR